MFEQFDHTADLGLRVRAGTLEELLAEAGRGLLAMIVANPDAVKPVQSKTIVITADEPELLLFDWLSELLYAFESEKLLLAEFDLHLIGQDSSCRQPRPEAPAGQVLPYKLTALCRGEPMDNARHEMDHEVKAITYHGLRAEKQPDGTWFAEVIVDI
jgi:SHS2 domain-containing protein